MVSELSNPGADHDNRRSQTSVLFQRARGHTGFLLGASLLAVVVFMAVFAPILAPHDPFDQDLTRRLLPPFWMEGTDPAHLFGTDQFGRDYLSRLIYGTRLSLVIGLTVVILAGAIGITLGVMAGFYGGWVDRVIMYVITVRLSLPVILIALSVASIRGSSLSVIIGVLGLFLWDRFAMVTRTATQRLRNQEFVDAAKAMGANDLAIILKEIVPNLYNLIIVVATLEMAQAILLEAALSFLGLGIQPPAPSWGLMIAEAKDFMLFSGWLVYIPGTALFALIIAINLLGDGVRDITAPEGR